MSRESKVIITFRKFQIGIDASVIRVIFYSHVGRHIVCHPEVALHSSCINNHRWYSTESHSQPNKKARTGSLYASFIMHFLLTLSKFHLKVQVCARQSGPCSRSLCRFLQSQATRRSSARPGWTAIPSIGFLTGPPSPIPI